MGSNPATPTNYPIENKSNFGAAKIIYNVGNGNKTPPNPANRRISPAKSPTTICDLFRSILDYGGGVSLFAHLWKGTDAVRPGGRA